MELKNILWSIKFAGHSDKNRSLELLKNSFWVILHKNNKIEKLANDITGAGFNRERECHRVLIDCEPIKRIHDLPSLPWHQSIH